MKVGPRTGTKYSVERSEKIENPTEAYNAGSGGTGSRNGLTINHAPTGTRPNRKIGDKGRGPSCILAQDQTDATIALTDIRT